VLKLANNRFTGPLPAEFRHIKAVAQLHLHDNDFSGNLPSWICTLPQLAVLAVEENNFDGALPGCMDELLQLLVFSAQGNQFVGASPGFPAQIQKLTLGNNQLTGPLPHITTLHALKVLDLHRNSFDGTIPHDLRPLSQLKALLLSNNRLSGSVALLPVTLEILLLDNNKLGGALPSLMPFRRLKRLTLFQNDFEGQLSLPAGVRMELLLAHSNRLSCQIQAPNTSLNRGGNSSLRGKALVTPGNAISGPPPVALHLSMARASFLWVSTFVDAWLHELIIVPCGLLALVCMVAASPHLLYTGTAEPWQQASCNALVAFVRVSPSAVRSKSCQRILQLQLWCFKRLAAWAVLGLLVLVPLYVSGARRYDCGELWLKSTIADLINSPVEEWCCAVAACVYAGMAAAAISELQSLETSRSSPVLQIEEPAVGVTPAMEVTWRKHAVLILLWLPIICILSLPMVLAMISLSVPPDENMLGLGEGLLGAASATMGAALYLIKSYALPALADLLTRLVYKDSPPSTAKGRLAMSGMFWIVVAVPSITVLIINEDCFAAWLKAGRFL